ncbi:phosphotransferase family protein [Streptomyces sp. NPDC049879]|uniref:phosphotransferase family protein n=1 Tax=Streptomyces sp. NPDC049879 TaxID=3365598 RepID=UPI0037B2AFF9
MAGTRQQDREVARAAAAAALGRDPGPLGAVESASHHVFVGRDVVVKIIDAAGHTRLGREVALASHLPAGITAPLLADGLHRLGGREVRYACYARMPGSAPGMGLPGVDAVTARRLAEEAVRRLGDLHSWTPGPEARDMLEEPLEHGGFTGRDALLAEVGKLAADDRERALSRRLLDGLTALAEQAPPRARTAVPVHADCHWDNWLVHEGRVTALLDFEWARLGEPADDWLFLARFAGPHQRAVLDVIARATAADPEELRAACEVREAAHLVSDLRAALHFGEGATDLLRDLEAVVLDRHWWRPAR